ncbi:PREDICTED: circumsporozoite protein-like [Ficedula albicollis]|uniref:circumsporozoite protein-like n=1 Tax=Ficedula albicollis TaxID=59894 RepID=UPI000359ADB7|nr:PREDICTED: circumsporozoite protein-like [Ficedula albicollis]
MLAAAVAGLTRPRPERPPREEPAGGAGGAGGRRRSEEPAGGAGGRRRSEEPAGGAGGRRRSEEPAGGAGGRRRSEEPAGGAGGRRRSEEPAGGAGGRRRSEEPAGGAGGRRRSEEPAGGAGGRRRSEREVAGGAPRAPDREQAPPTPPDWLRTSGARSPLAAALGTARGLGERECPEPTAPQQTAMFIAGCTGAFGSLVSKSGESDRPLGGVTLTNGMFSSTTVCCRQTTVRTRTRATGTAISAGPEFLTHKLHLCPSEYPPDCHASPLHPHYQYSMKNKESSIVCNVLSCASTTC